MKFRTAVILFGVTLCTMLLAILLSQFLQIGGVSKGLRTLLNIALGLLIGCITARLRDKLEG